MFAELVLVTDGDEHMALYMSGKKIWQGTTEERNKLFSLVDQYGYTSTEIKRCVLGPKDAEAVMNNLDSQVFWPCGTFLETLDDYTDTDIPRLPGSEGDDAEVKSEGASCSSGGCSGGCACPSTPAPKEDEDDGIDTSVIFTYEDGEYQLVLERLRVYAEEWPTKRDELATTVAEMDLETDGAFSKFFTASSNFLQVSFMQKWAKEIMDATKKSGESDDVSVDINGHRVNQQGCPFLFFHLQIQRRGLAKTLIDSTRQGANAADYTGLINNEALTAMSIFIDDFVQLAPSLKKVDLGKKDPLYNTI